MKKLVYLSCIVLTFFSACKREDIGSLDVYDASSLQNIDADWVITPNHKEVTEAGKVYDLSTWTIKATIKNAIAYRYSASMSCSGSTLVSGSGLEQEVRYQNKGTYTAELTINTASGTKIIKKSFVQTFDTGLPMSEDEKAYAMRLLAGKTFVLDVAAKGHLANTWWEADPNGKASSRCYDDEFTFKSDFTFTCSTNGFIYGNPGAKGSLSKFPALSFDSDESQYDIFIKVDESKRAQYTYEVRKMKDNPADPKSTESYYIIFNNDEASLGYFDEMVANGPRKYKIINDDGDDNNFTSQVWAYNADGSPNYFRQTKLVVKGYVPPVTKKPDGIYNLKETFEGDFKLDYNWTKHEDLVFDVTGKKYLFNPAAAQTSIVTDPTGGTNNVVKVHRDAAERWGFLYAPTLPVPIKSDKGLTVAVKVYVPASNKYAWNGNRESWSWDPTGQPASELINFRIRIENPNASFGGNTGAWTTRVEKDVNLSQYVGQWVTVVFNMTKPLQETAAAKNETKYINVGFMFGREGYEHTDALDIYYDDIIITTPDLFSDATVSKSKSAKMNVINVY